MEQTPELTKALSELKRLTGLTMQITADTPEETATALEQIRCLCTAYREKYNKNDFLLSLMKNGIPAYDIYERAGRLHIPVEEKRVIYLLKTKELTDTIIEILRNLFPDIKKPPRKSFSPQSKNLSCSGQQGYTFYPSPGQVSLFRR